MAKTTQASSDELLAKIEKDRKAVLEKRAAAYRRLVECVANGSLPEADEVTQALDGVGKAPGDLAKDVRLLSRRRELRAILDRQPLEEAERTELMRKIEEEKQRFLPLQEEHNRAMRELGGRLQQLNDNTVHQGTAREELLRTAPDGLTDEVAYRERELEQLHRARGAMDKKIAANRERAQHLRDGLTLERPTLGGHSEFRNDEARELIEELETKAAEWEAQRNEGQPTIAAAEARIAALTEAIFRP